MTLIGASDNLNKKVLKLTKLRSIKVRLIYLDPVNSCGFLNRKELSVYLEKKTKEVYSNSLSK